MDEDYIASQARLLRIDDAAERLGVARPTVFRMVKNGEIARVLHAGKAYISESAIKDYYARLNAQAEKERAAAAKNRRGDRKNSQRLAAVAG